jgi:hypothetical protein
MPRMNGFQFCRALRERAEHSAMPVVLMSARTDKIREQFVQQTGAIDAITKPFDAQALVAVIEHAMRRIRSGRLSPSVASLPEDLDNADSGRVPSGDIDVRVARAAIEMAKQVADTVAPALAPIVQGAPPDAAQVASALTAYVAPEAMKALAQSIQALDFGGRGKLVLSGELTSIPVGAVLQMLQVEQKTGVLSVSNTKTEISIAMTEGLIDFVEARNAGEEFRLGRFFVERGLVTPDQLDEVLGRQAEMAARIARASNPPPASGAAGGTSGGDGSAHDRPTIELAPPSRNGSGRQSLVDLLERTGQWAAGEAPVDLPAAPPLLGDVLLQSGYVTEQNLREALARQSSELTYEVLRWQRGRFEFRKGAPLAVAVTAKLGLPVAHVVMEGFRRVDEWRLIEERVDNFDAVLQSDASAVAALGDAALARAEQQVLELIDGERTVREVVALSHMSSFDACKVLYQLLEARLVRRRTA